MIISLQRESIKENVCNTYRADSIGDRSLSLLPLGRVSQVCLGE